MTEPILNETVLKEEVEEVKEAKPQTLWKGVMGGALGCASVLAMWSLLGGANPSMTPPQQSVSPVVAQTANNQTLIDIETAIIGAANVAKDAVVSVVNKQEIRSFDWWYTPGSANDLPSEGGELVTAGEGSGVVYKTEGDKAYIVTNQHVVNGAQAVDVIMSDGTTVEAEVVGEDIVTDLAVLKIDAKYAKTTIQFADSGAVQVGSLAIAIGSPLGSVFSNSVTQGIVSGLDRPHEIDISGDGIGDWTAHLLQTDAAINPGNSGGALVNKNGQLIGINSSKFRDVEGMGFAIPSNEVQSVIAELEAHGRVIRPVLGIVPVDVQGLSWRSRVKVLGLPEDMYTGVAIKEVTPGSTADKFELQPYDVITGIDDQKIETTSDLYRVLYTHKVGDEVNVTVLRQGEEMQFKVALEAFEQETLE
ncbi:trypsin-like peptidase domain-containing protein [Aerococcaceae bacterium NML191292]|nr:trypsin-like peptidase domain-containing protein [Aerococcaceae bacterium NML191292]MCW6674946.1 trypsin-like peptidase domain-containing protein [Aerococcaceae bacterium NML171108]MCW6680897.1 trypsin-like peptidase domain-containing protein [Aerococcaceae bacterium NML130460]